jgi:hypothetical protein
MTREHRMPDVKLDELKFHWEKWRDESKAFWSRAILGTAILLASILFQYKFLSVSLPGVTLSLPAKPFWFYLLVNLLSWYLLGFLCFKFIDLLRHRVPEKIEMEIHNNDLPNPIYSWHLGPPTIDLKRWGRYLYLIFPVYAVTLGGLLLVAFVRTLMI